MTAPAPALAPLAVDRSLTVAAHSRAARTGMVLALAGIGMLFTAFTSAYVVRHGLDPNWLTLPMPRALVPNTLVLLASSLCVERARRARDNRWLAATVLLGALFVAGQVAVWRGLVAAGVYFPSSAHSSFFYLLTAAHAAHLAGGLAALSWTATVTAARRPLWLANAALYWHFMGALWLYLVILLFGWR